jgi:hypothetical protein
VDETRELFERAHAFPACRSVRARSMPARRPPHNHRDLCDDLPPDTPQVLVR